MIYCVWVLVSFLEFCRRLLTFFYPSTKLGRIGKQKERIWLQETTSWWLHKGVLNFFCFKSSQKQCEKSENIHFQVDHQPDFNHNKVSSFLDAHVEYTFMFSCNSFWFQSRVDGWPWNVYFCIPYIFQQSFDTHDTPWFVSVFGLVETYIF